MRTALAKWIVGFLLGAGLAALVGGMLLSRNTEATGEFSSRLDLTPLDRSAVFDRGRLKSFDSFAQEIVSRIAGRGGVQEPGEAGRLPADAAYLDMMIRASAYDDADVIHIKKKPMRFQLASALKTAGVGDPARLDGFVERGQISESLLRTDVAAAVMDQWSRDLVRTAKFVDQIEGAIGLRSPEALSSILRIVPAPGGAEDTPWLSINELWPPDTGAPRTPGHELAASIEPEVADGLRASWARFVRAWRDRDADGANAAIAEFCGLLPLVAPDAYPDRGRLLFESLYFKAAYLVWGWVIYLLAVAVLLMSVAFRWDGARWLGLGVFSAAFLVQTASVALRWYVSGRWPNSNMFEAVTTSVWFGAVIAIGLEIVARRTPLRGLFAVCAGVASMAAMMSAQLIPRLDPSINNMMPILDDLWLYIHTNTIIASYALIAMAGVTSAIYLGRRFVLGGSEYARVGGTAMLLDAGDGARGRPFGEILDGATLILMELSFVMLWAGIIMGAIWADHSWGRPWGWDPKEVFALNTFLVFLILIHVRLHARDKGLWTAVLALIGCAVMLFNWIVINFVIAGLHSYA